jgi:hypothetical protein
MDYIEQRHPFYESADKIFNACVDNKIEGCIAAHTVLNLFYILRKQYTVEERRQLLKGLCTIFTVIGIDNVKLIDALNDTGFDDFEDCIQAKCAVAFDADYIITRNIKDFVNAQVKCLDSDTFVNTILDKI